MPGINDIDFSKVTLPSDMTPEKVVKQYEDAIEDLKRLNIDFERYFSNKRRKSKTRMLTMNIFDTVNSNVSFHQDGMIDVEPLLQYITNDDRPLFADVCKFVYQFFEDKPMNDIVFNRFKGLLIYYLCRVGF
jgi:hypothetical protein